MKIIRKRFIYICKASGELKESDFMLVTEEIDTDDLKEYEFLCAAEFIGIDAGVRAYLNMVPPGITMIGGQVAKIIESKHPRYVKNSYVYGQFGWQTHSIINPERENGCKVYSLPDFGHRSVSLGLGVLGMPGNAAYFGFTEICKPKTGDTVVVSSAAGGVGLHVGQLAKIHGCRVIGIAGSDEKCTRLKQEFGYDEAINYKSDDFKMQLNKCIPNGVDCYFDNVGGDISSKIVQKMNEQGRIAVCGAVSTYNDNPFKPSSTDELSRNFIHKQLHMAGFRVWRWSDRWTEGIEQNLEWLNEGKLKSHETIIHGIQKAPGALINLLRGKYFGKVVVSI